jgi:SAM-dependent methyltransferase
MLDPRNAMPLLPALLSKPPAAPPGSEFERLCSILSELYRETLAAGAPTAYMQEHARPKCVANQVRTFQWYQPFLPAAGSILDWGCNHAPDSCLLRAQYGERFELHGCDFLPAGAFPTFYSFADFAYRQLDDVVRLPYPSEFFDVVVGSGALEHAAMDYESLKELYRVLKPGGLFIASYLPNRLSIAEWRRRVLYRRDFHRRLYTRSSATELLKHAGFYPLTVDHHTFIWERLLGRRIAGLAGGLLRWLLPVHLFCSTLCFVARKQHSM